MALQRWGEPRVTRDVGLTLLCPFGNEAAAVDRLLAKFRPRMEGARSLALQRRVLLLWSAGGIGVDIAFGALPFEERCVEQASDWELSPGIVLHTCSAEDLVILKTFAGRPRDWIDVESVLVRQGHLLDLQSIRNTLAKVKPDVIVNAAAYTAVDRAEREKDVAFEVNCQAVKELAREAKSLDALLIHFSTDYVFDGEKRTPYVEPDTPSPLNIYGHSKLVDERAIAASH